MFETKHWSAVVLMLAVGLSAIDVRADYGMALGAKPKYQPGFTHFDYANPKAPQGGTLTLGGEGSFDTLNGYGLKGDPPEGSDLIFETLMTKSSDEAFSMYGLLADDMTIAEDGLSVTFHLNPAAKFSDGQPVTAAAVVSSFKTLMSPAAKPFYRFYYADVKDAVALDTQTVRFTFHQKNRELPFIVAELPVLAPNWGGGKSLDKIVLDKPIGSGPYVLDRFELGKNIHYRRNPNYWGKQLPTRRGFYNFERIVFKYYRDTTIRLEAFKAGEFDLIHENSAKQWATGYNGPKFRNGLITKQLLPNASPAGMQGFGFNLRKPLFKDIRVRQALGLALDFEWSNRMLFYGQYTRGSSYFNNSEMMAKGKPAGAELALLNRYRNQLPAAVFDAPLPPPNTDEPSSLRANLRQARELLRQAGWVYKDGALRNKQGQPMQIELLLVSKAFERIAAPYARNLEKLGITLSARTVDPSLYQKRMQRFEFDMTIVSFPMSVSPGNELLGYFNSKAALSPESNNSIGISDPVVDALVGEVVRAQDRQALITACRALDRVLLAGFYVVPNWYVGTHRVAWWKRFEHPKTLPLYYQPTSWAIENGWVNESPKQ